MTINENKFDSRDAMLETLYQLFVDDIEQALATQSTATLLLSGGSTPVPLYRSLAGASLDWSRVHVALVDERTQVKGTPVVNPGPSDLLSGTTHTVEILVDDTGGTAFTTVSIDGVICDAG